jgi:hypothetical protein
MTLDSAILLVSRFLLEFRTLIDEAKIVVDSAYAALDRLRNASEIDAVREMLKEADDLLAQALSRSPKSPNAIAAS